MEDSSWTKRDCGEGFAENDRILVWYGRGKNQRTYEAKVIGTEENERRREYLVHYSGWNNRSVQFPPCAKAAQLAGSCIGNAKPYELTMCVCTCTIIVYQ